MVRTTVLLSILLTLVSCASSPEHYVARGNQLSESGRYADASLQYRKALQKNPQFGEAYFRLGLTELKQQQVAAAMRDLEQAVRLMPGRDDVKLHLADLYLTAYLADRSRPRSLYDRIAALAGELAAKNANSYAALRLKGFLAMTDAQPEQAAALFRQSLTLRAEQPDVVTALVQNLLLSQHPEEAESTARAFLESHKTYEPLYDVLYDHYRTWNRITDAENLLRAKVANNPRDIFPVLQLSRHYWNEGRSDLMEKLLSTVREQPQLFQSVHLELGDFYSEIRNWDAAARQYREGAAQAPAEALVYQKRIAQTLIAQQKTGEALQLLDEIIRRSPEDEPARASRVGLWLGDGQTGSVEKAVSELKKLLEKAPDNTNYHYQLGYAYARQDAVREASAQFLAVLTRQPNHMGALVGLAEMNIRTQQYQVAMSYADRALQLNPQATAALLVRSASLAAFGRYDETRSLLNKLIHDNPQSQEARLQLGLLNLAQRRYAEAEDIFHNYRPQSGDIRAIKGLVEIYKAQNRPGKAIAAIQEELSRNPQSAGLHLLLAATAADIGNRDLAAAEYEKIAAAAPGDANVALSLGQIYEGKGDFNRAVQQFERAEKNRPRDPSPPALLARTLDEAGRKREAVAAYRRSLAAKPDSPVVKNNLAYLLSETGGSLDEALRLAVEARQSDPENVLFADTMAWIQLQRKETVPALQTLQALVRKQPDNATLRLHLGQSLIAAGQAEAARKELQAALDAQPSREETAEIQRLLK
ncbi:MAG: hypothetical protein C5B51_18090 [Terriglobia bacterium]|nr:MAG: hypothetical protein C5B51_18090 [Terriglobia bacterium]